MIKPELLGLDKGETILHEIKRHPIGLIGIYLTGAIMFLAVISGVIITAANKGDLGVNIPDALIVLVALVAAFFVLVFVVVAAYVYKNNVLILTNENLIQVLQFGLFNRQISHLNLAQVQDVSSDKVGILQTMFNYGTLEVETAGEASNFRFTFARNPEAMAQQINEAHESYTESR